jgi:hypothetical protein
MGQSYYTYKRSKRLGIAMQMEPLVTESQRQSPDSNRMSQFDDQGYWFGVQSMGLVGKDFILFPTYFSMSIQGSRIAMQLGSKDIGG